MTVPQKLDRLVEKLGIAQDSPTLYVLCRRGRDAAKATKALDAILGVHGVSCITVAGGLMQLIADVPELQNFPFL